MVSFQGKLCSVVFLDGNCAVVIKLKSVELHSVLSSWIFCSSVSGMRKAGFEASALQEIRAPVNMVGRGLLLLSFTDVCAGSSVSFQVCSDTAMVCKAQAGILCQ